MEAQRVLGAELGPGERLVWSGRPQQGLMLRPSDALFIPFSLMWGGFAFFWEYSVLNSKAPVFMALWGIPFVLVGIYLIVGRFFVDAQQRTKTWYGITDERALIVSGLFSKQVKSLPLATLTELTLSERADGSGTITFGPAANSWMASGGWPGMREKVSPCFEAIERARQVYQMLRARPPDTR